MLFLEIIAGVIIYIAIITNYSVWSSKRDQKKIDEDDSFLAEIFLF